MRRLIVLLTLLLTTFAHPTHAQDALGPGFYDQIVPAILFENFTWNLTNDANNYGGSRTGTGGTSSTAPRIRFNVYGDGFILYVFKSSGGGEATVSINGTLIATVSWFSPSVVYMATISITGLGWGSNGIHEVVIQKSTGGTTAINLDALHVLPHVVYPTSVVQITLVAPESTQWVNVANWEQAELTLEVQPPDYQNTWDIDDQRVAFDYRVDVGQMVIVSLLSVIVMGMFVMIFLVMRGMK